MKNKKTENEWSDYYLYDLETYKKCFTAVFKQFRGDKETIKTFIISDYQNDLKELKSWLKKKKRILVGYNNLGFDGQIIEHILKGKVRGYKGIFDFSQEVIKSDRFNKPYSIFNFSIPQVDLMEINNYGIGTATTTSLKWLEFSMRFPKMKDLPIPFDKETLTEAEVSKVAKYNINDVLVTEDFMEKCLSKIEMRKSLISIYKKRWWMNLSDSSIGKQILFENYCKKAKADPKKVKKSFTLPDEIVVKKIIQPYIKFSTKEFKEVKKDFEKLRLVPEKGAYVLKGVYHKNIKFQDIEIDYALGGIHGVKTNSYTESCDKYVIKSVDVVSFYPRYAMVNEVAPSHLKKKKFVKAYTEIFELRKKHPKPDPLNYAFKISLNACYGLTNSKRNNFLKDPSYTLKTTVNGQLLLTMLAEELSKIGGLIMLNTDGLEIKIPRNKEKDYERICKDWENLTGLELEHENYEWIFIKDVNNYLSLNDKGKVKRKGFFLTYEDYSGFYNKNPSATIIPLAINNFLVNQTPLHETITEHDNIHDFLYGVKGQRNFQYWFLKTAENIVGKVDKRTERALRYYVSKTGSNMFKFWKDGRKNNLQGVSTGQLTTPLMNIPRGGKIYNAKTGESYYPNINYDYYIQEAQSVIDQIMQP